LKACLIVGGSIDTGVCAAPRAVTQLWR